MDRLSVNGFIHDLQYTFQFVLLWKINAKLRLAIPFNYMDTETASKTWIPSISQFPKLEFEMQNKHFEIKILSLFRYSLLII